MLKGCKVFQKFSASALVTFFLHDSIYLQNILILVWLGDFKAIGIECVRKVMPRKLIVLHVYTRTYINVSKYTFLLS